jgi:putative PIG3 family NAD(P)H quinone oxidoreductase
MIPTNMRFVSHGRGGTAEVLEIAETATPIPGPREVLLEVEYAGVNRPDILHRSGTYPPPPGASPILGLEVSGHVVARGAEVDEWKVGDSVCALTPGGGYAEYCLADASHCLAVPRGLDLKQAAALPENLFTVWHNLIERGRLKAGETVLVHGGSSGIGYMAVQLAKQYGAEVLATVGSDQKAELCRKLGADLVINYRTRDFVAEIENHIGKHGVNVILDIVGGDYLPRNVGLLAPEGRLVQIAFLQGSKVSEFDFLPVMVRRLTITGSTLRPRTVEQKAAIARSLRDRVWPLLETGKVKVVIHHIFPLAQVGDAHRQMEQGQHLGKILLQVR